jgi:alpha-glucuronidase
MAASCSIARLSTTTISITTTSRPTAPAPPTTSSTRSTAISPNVIVQTKEGPIDFQAREPVSPLFAGLKRPTQAMEVQITQEYTGQQRHLVYLAPMWKQVLDFDLHADEPSTPVKEIIEGKSFHQPLGGMVGVASVGRDGWLGSPLAMANLYAFGRLAWDPNLTPEQIADEWTRQTIGTLIRWWSPPWRRC